MVSTFDVGHAQIGENTSLFFPYAVAKDSIALQAPIRVLTFRTLCRWLAEDDSVGPSVFLDDDDIVGLTAQVRSDAAASDGAPTDGKNVRQVQCISLAERLLDTVPVYKHLEYNREFIRHLALGENLDPRAVSGALSQPREELEAVLWSVLSGDDPDETVSERTVQELVDWARQATSQQDV